MRDRKPGTWILMGALVVEESKQDGKEGWIK
jgi:hypothetical protein